MNLPRRQRGFLQVVAQIVGALIVLALAARFLWWVVTEENFDQVAAIVWAIGFGVAYFIALPDVFVARMPAGFAVFALLSAATLPLTWLGESRIGLFVLLAAQLAFSFNAGRVLSNHLRARVLSRYPAGQEPAWLRQEGDLVADLGRWVILASGALMVFLIAPLLVLLIVSLIVDLSAQEVKWAVALWGLAGITWFGFNTGAARWGRIPACAWIYLMITAGILGVDMLAGPFAEGTGVQVAYTTMPGALIAAFVEVFVLRGSGITKSVSSVE